MWVCSFWEPRPFRGGVWVAANSIFCLIGSTPRSEVPRGTNETHLHSSVLHTAASVEHCSVLLFHSRGGTGQPASIGLCSTEYEADTLCYWSATGVVRSVPINAKCTGERMGGGGGCTY